jgi:hypothetical protein
VDPNLVVLNIYNIRSVRPQRAEEGDDGSVLIHDDERVLAFEQASALFRSISDALNEVRVEVYAPVQWRDLGGRAKAIASLRPRVAEELDNAREPQDTE